MSEDKIDIARVDLNFAEVDNVRLVDVEEVFQIEFIPLKALTVPGQGNVAFRRKKSIIYRR